MKGKLLHKAEGTILEADLALDTENPLNIKIWIILQTMFQYNPKEERWLISWIFDIDS